MHIISLSILGSQLAS